MKDKIIEIVASNYDLIDYKFIRTREEEIMQNMGNILSRIKNNVPLARHKGLGEHIDKPSQVAAVLTSSEAVEETERDEERFLLEEIEIFHDEILTGKITLKVKGVIADG